MSEQPQSQQKETKKNSYWVAFRLLQFVFLGVFALGISSMTGEWSSWQKWPFSVFSIDSTIFGAIGVVMSEIFARLSSRWNS